MISKSSRWSNVRGMKNSGKPFLLQPAGKDYLWGGNRLNEEFSKNMPQFPLAETWEGSTHPDGQSKVASGEEKGKYLSDYIRRYPECMGTHPRTKEELPILIKLIDAKENLSVQVHPTDEYAAKKEHGALGKSELWYVLDASKDAKLMYGLSHDIEKEELRQSIQDGTLDQHLQKIPVKKDDLFFVEAGTIHAIGAGALLVEIQENSNLTYRMYDYDRIDKDGKKRTLQIEKALDVANRKASKRPVQPMRVLKYRNGCASELLTRCKYFEVHRVLINTERNRRMVSYASDGTSFRVLLCVNGCGSIHFDGEVLEFFQGDCIFVPANSIEMRIHGKATFLDVRA